jgi:hypothetical protein
MPTLTDDEEKRKQYAGLPAYLVPVVTQNLANPDVSKVNAAGRLTALPGVGQPGSTPQTDVTNLNVADAMERSDIGHRFGFGSQQYLATNGQATPDFHDLVDNAISAKRDAIESRKNQVLTRLGVIQPAQGTSVVLAGPRERHDLLNEWKVLEGESNQALLEHHYNAAENARNSHENFIRNRAIQTDQEFSGLTDYLGNIQAPIGTPEHAQEVLKGVTMFPRGAMSQAGKLLLKEHAQTHDNLSDILANVRAQGLEPSLVERTAGGGFNVHFKQPGGTSPDLEKELKSAHGLTLSQIANPVAVDVGRFATAEDVKAKRADKVGAFIGDSAGNLVSIDTGNKQKGSVHMPVREYIRFGGKLSPQDEAAQTAQPTANAAPAVPEIGSVRSGYRFKGGNPADKNAWEQVK